MQWQCFLHKSSGRCFLASDWSNLPETARNPDIDQSQPHGRPQDENLAAECSVCGSPAAAHLHYGAVSCYSCRAFFRRGQPKQIRWGIRYDKTCVIRYVG